MHYHGHRERLRERLKSAPEKMLDYEILEMLLGYVIRRADTKPMAKALLTRFRTLRGVVSARPEEFLDIPGLGPGVADFLLLLREFIARYAESRLRAREVLSAPAEVAAMARERIGALTHEEVWIAFVNNNLGLISWEKFVQGTISSASVDIRAILKQAFLLDAPAFILVHNHPGGNARPSKEDLEITRILDEAARLLSLRFVDHVIVTEADCFSIMHDGFL